MTEKEIGGQLEEIRAMRVFDLGVLFLSLVVGFGTTLLMTIDVMFAILFFLNALVWGLVIVRDIYR